LVFGTFVLFLLAVGYRAVQPIVVFGIWGIGRRRPFFLFYYLLSVPLLDRVVFL
jgi:hypothetical protein